MEGTLPHEHRQEWSEGKRVTGLERDAGTQRSPRAESLTGQDTAHRICSAIPECRLRARHSAQVKSMSCNVKLSRAVPAGASQLGGGVLGDSRVKAREL